ncbi:cupredoxin domain-containing protein [Natronolimnobius baerhuensis]|uniref:Blue (type 1) copper domain-containing protein n=1 Tax=Natronolimnobius baerhuensis TaxID=253108 RepID=A0A202E7C4_9EURY|nr:plastocyanin/azurin family copper-binding protein [Natronolimnobius baerhuensis]OVE84145.1 hypothetical protein B2G88_06895 [Natronolimnobius baerhuensis]
MTTSHAHTGTLRRTLLRAAAATGLAVGIGSATTQARLQDDADIVLEGRTTGWVGVEPDDIDGERNPTLELEAGTEYVLVWENEDGVGHNFVIEDDDGENLVETEIISGSGETQTVEFTAEEGMAEYYCAPHPQSMRGDVELGDAGEDEDEDTADDPDETVLEFAAVVEEHFEFTLEDDGWILEESDEIDADDEDLEADDENEQTDDVNPTLELEAGSAYVLTWTNDLEASEETDTDAEETDEDDAEETATDNADDDLEEQATELVLETDDGEEFLRSEALEVGETGAITFAAPPELVTYRDEETGAEGEIEVTGDEDAETETDT